MRIAWSIAVYFAALIAMLLLSMWRLRDLALSGAPLVLWLPFTRPLLSAAFEACLLVGIPVAALAAWNPNDDRSDRAVASGRVFRGLAALATLLIAFTVTSVIATDTGSRAPGLLAQELIDTGRQTCEAAQARTVVDVPLVQVSWACQRGTTPMVQGNVLGIRGADFRATSLRVSEDLRKLDLANVHLELPPAHGRLGARVSVARARISGLPPWGRARHVPLRVRLSASVLGVIGILAVGFGLLAKRWFWSRGGFLLGAAGGVSLLLAHQALDRAASGALIYFLVAPIGACAVALLAAVVRGALAALGRVRRVVK